MKGGKRGIIAVTGADAALGLATTAALVEAGVTVVMGCSDASKGIMLAERINGVTHRLSAIVVGEDGLDLGSARSIRGWSDDLRDCLMQECDRLEAVVHHAGCMGLGAYTRTSDGDDEMQWAMNYMGAFRLTQQLWDTLLDDGTQVLCLTSTSHCTPDTPLDWSRSASSEATYHGWRAYQQSKLAMLLFSNELNRRFVANGCLATSRAVCETDKWFILPQLLLPDDKKELAAGPTTTMAALRGLGLGGDYLVDGQVGKPGAHALREDDGLRLWETSMTKLSSL